METLWDKLAPALLASSRLPSSASSQTAALPADSTPRTRTAGNAAPYAVPAEHCSDEELRMIRLVALAAGMPILRKGNEQLYLGPFGEYSARRYTAASVDHIPFATA